MAEVGRAAVRDPGALLPGGFWAAVAVWLERPQVANKRLCGVRLEARRSVALPRAAAGPRPRSPGEGLGPGQTTGPAQGTAIRGPGESQPRHGQRENRREVAAAARLAGDSGPAGEAGVGESDFPASNLDSLWDAFSQSLDGGHPELLAFLSWPGAGSQPEAPSSLAVVLRTLIPKTGPRCPLAVPRRELVVQDVLNGTVTFLPLEEDDGGNVKVETSNVYQIRLSQSQEEWFISILIFCPERWHSDGIVYPQPAWLGEELLARLARWSVESKKSAFKSTLSLISITKYSKTYQMLKEKYKDMVKVWPEVTDPKKFVYEDVAIAAYLLHPGRGIDVRRRKIWDMYGPQTFLEEGAITPSDKTLFPDVDWLIGNHSDELTPWVPVIAARSSYGCRFFVLPCCFFDFTGKYSRRQSRKTQYREYLDFITEVGLTCGFHVEEDCLRIPSTKRVCLIGKSRTYPPAGEVAMDEQRTQYINSRRGRPMSPPGEASVPPPPRTTVGHAGHPGGHQALDTGSATGGAEIRADQLWLSGFQPREKAEHVRNCATLPRDFIDQVVLQVAHLLLDGEQLNTGSASSGSSKAWNRGGSLSLAEVARELAGETLQRLKRECGGLQTLLRNNHQVFEVVNGRVHIRDWREEKLQRQPHSEAKRRLCSEAFKTRVCWFYSHHPDGCVLPSDSCPFAHGPAELRLPRTPKRKKPVL
ncbi:probable tRNA (uracil-O(2)-)-methyltransferase isoform X2 [Lontra canadensis]|uniref:probable tRNA (uracil-O(2)-)-methyltransferase isoform X2 n=1 Tax=Lontra canadensis TaxID=76717 RepID=UPI0013F2F948|nr:probable tRNA (uracil-O(2)-)-methyltransferase isoform X2 [Lontra canadensis]